MRKVIVNEWMTLDGVVQAPGAADEDTSGGFEHGGWHVRYFHDLSRRWVVENLSGAGGFLLGRRTYESFAGYWPNASEDEQVLAQPLNTLPRIVGVRHGLPVLEDNRTLQVTNVVWCTGYRQDFSWIDLPVFGENGQPVHDRGIVRSVPGLYFVGLPFLYSVSSDVLPGVGRDAKRIAKHLVHANGTARRVALLTD